jgi:hypothetical protein
MELVLRNSLIVIKLVLIIIKTIDVELGAVQILLYAPSQNHSFLFSHLLDIRNFFNIINILLYRFATQPSHKNNLKTLYLMYPKLNTRIVFSKGPSAVKKSFHAKLVF